ncbi:hypothetical protein GR131_27740 [Streptomyces sp. GF20]|uniref:hypothetical protein n=1 Tax=Streptomyces TaxID=1883 RepID=UPI0013172623|nr:hypothetical protein [Streptomyces sp. GF20]QHC18919.1 hypothetical protein GR131_27740 [Streptomyces sp. GF20]
MFPEPPAAVEPRLPLAFTAFTARVAADYMAFATVRTGCPQDGEGVVQEALGDLVVRWEQALSSPSPAAVAWDLLSRRVNSCIPPAASSSAYRVLPRLHADVMVLRYRLGIRLTGVAELLGVDDIVVCGMVRSVTDGTWHMRSA